MVDKKLSLSDLLLKTYSNLPYEVVFSRVFIFWSSYLPGPGSLLDSFMTSSINDSFLDLSKRAPRPFHDFFMFSSKSPAYEVGSGSLARFVASRVRSEFLDLGKEISVDE